MVIPSSSSSEKKNKEKDILSMLPPDVGSINVLLGERLLIDVEYAFRG